MSFRIFKMGYLQKSNDMLIIKNYAKRKNHLIGNEVRNRAITTR